jgi:hypothetical protein
MLSLSFHVAQQSKHEIYSQSTYYCAGGVACIEGVRSPVKAARYTNFQKQKNTDVE